MPIARRARPARHTQRLLATTIRPTFPSAIDTTAATKAKPAPEQPFDLSALQKLNLEGSLRIGALKVANVKSSKLRIDVKAKKGQVNVSPLSANLYEGSMNGSVAINAAQATPVFTVKQILSGVQLGPLIKDAVELDMVEGKGNVTVNIVTRDHLDIAFHAAAAHGTVMVEKFLPEPNL